MRRTLFLLTILVCFSATKSSAVVDSMYANYAVVTFGQNAEYAKGAPDGQQAQINPAGELYLQFLYNDKPVSFAPNSILHIYWKQQSADSTAAVVTMFNLTGTSESRHDSIMTIDKAGMITVTVPKSGYNAIGFRLSGPEGGTGGSVVFFVDAVALLQANLAVPGRHGSPYVFSVYPNPSLLQSGINLQLANDYVGRSTVTIYNLLGEEVLSESIDQSSTHLQLETKGTFLARVTVDGVPLGEAFKFTVE